MSFKNYPKKLDTKSRMARKHARREVFVFNHKASKARRKAAKVARQVAVEENENRHE